MSADSNPQTSQYRWVMLAALWLGYFCFGMVSASLAPLITRIGQDLDLSHTALGVVMGAWALVYIAAAMPAGAALDRFGSRMGMAAGLFLVAASGLARAAAGDFTSLFLAVAIFGVGGPLISVGAPKVISQWFSSKERGTAMGIYMTGPYLGSAFALASANTLLMPLFGDSWRLTVGAYGLLALAGSITWLLVAREPGAASGEADGGKQAAGLKAFGALLRVDVVRTILVISLAAFMFNHGINAWLPTILRARGLDAAAAGLWASVPTLVGVVSALTIPRFAISERRVGILASLYGCLVLATLMLAFTEGAGLIGGLILLGVARIIGTIALLILMEAPRVGARNMGAATGLYFTVGEIGGVIGPTMMGVVADITGSFIGSILALNFLALFLLLMTVPLRQARMRGAVRQAGE